MSDLHREEKDLAIRILDRLHRECAEENGDHPDECDTAFSHGADGIRREAAIPALIAQARREALEEALEAVSEVAAVWEAHAAIFGLINMEADTAHPAGSKRAGE